MAGDRGTPRLFEHFSLTQSQLSPAGEAIIASSQRSQCSSTFFAFQFLPSSRWARPPRSAHQAHDEGIEAIKRPENSAHAHCPRSFLSFLIVLNSSFETPAFGGLLRMRPSRRGLPAALILRDAALCAAPQDEAERGERQQPRPTAVSGLVLNVF